MIQLNSNSVHAHRLEPSHAKQDADLISRHSHKRATASELDRRERRHGSNSFCNQGCTTKDYCYFHGCPFGGGK